MAWYNPQKISIDPNSGVIGASGAMGRALYDLYQDNVKNNFTAAKLDEEARANAANEQLRGAKLQQDLDLSNRDFDFKQQRAKAQDEQWGKSYEAVQAQNAFNRNIAAQRLGLERDRLNMVREARAQALAQANAPKTFNDYGDLYAQRETYKANFGDREKPDFKGDLAQELAYLNAMNKNAPKLAQAQEAQADPLKNLPVATQNRLNGAASMLNMLIPYGADLETNESQWSGGLDALTAPAAQKIGLGSDYLNDLYARADAIAELKRANTKGGAYAVKQNTKDRLAPGRVLANTTYSGVGAEILEQLAVYDETINTLKAQGNYKGADALEARKAEFVNQISPQIAAIVNKGAYRGGASTNGESDQTAAALPQNIGARLKALNNAKKSLDYTDLDDMGALYQEW